MKKLFLFLIFLSLPTFASTKIPIEMVKILDGDTVKAKIDKNKFSIRLIGIDCAETSKIHRAYKQAYLENKNIDEIIKEGKIATDYLKELNKKAEVVSFDFKGVDKYSRVLGILYFDDLNVNDEMKNYCKEYVYLNN